MREREKKIKQGKESINMLWSITLPANTFLLSCFTSAFNLTRSEDTSSSKIEPLSKFSFYMSFTRNLELIDAGYEGILTDNGLSYPSFSLLNLMENFESQGGISLSVPTE